MKKQEALEKLREIAERAAVDDPADDIDPQYAAEMVILALIDDAEIETAFWEASR